LDLVLDASPLIYLGKLDALDVFGAHGWRPMITPAVRDEVVRPELAYMHTEVVTIAAAIEHGSIRDIQLTPAEVTTAAELGRRVRGLHPGELEVLAVGLERSSAVSVHERQAARLARALALREVQVVELLVDGTADARLLEKRLRGYASLTVLRVGDLDELLAIARARHHE